MFHYPRNEAYSTLISQLPKYVGFVTIQAGLHFTERYRAIFFKSKASVRNEYRSRPTW